MTFNAVSLALVPSLDESIFRLAHRLLYLSISGGSHPDGGGRLRTKRVVVASHFRHATSARSEASASIAGKAVPFAIASSSDGTNISQAQRLLYLSISGGYLSDGRGHLQSRRVVADRHARQNGPSFSVGSLHLAGEADWHTSCNPDDIESLYTSYVAQRPRITGREEYRLAALMKAGDLRARDALIESNLGLVVMLARRYLRPGVPLLDLIAEGNIGLLTAADRFDPERGNRFSTYAKWWVLKAMRDALPTLVGVVRQPVGKLWLNASTDVAYLEDEDPPESLMSAHADSRAEQGPDVTESTIADLALNLAAPSADGVLSEICEAEDREPPQELMARQRSAILQSALDSLSERQRIVISQRFALTTDEAYSLNDVAVVLGVSIERVRVIEKAALEKLRLALKTAGLTAEMVL